MYPFNETGDRIYGIGRDLRRHWIGYFNKYKTLFSISVIIASQLIKSKTNSKLKTAQPDNLGTIFSISQNAKHNLYYHCSVIERCGGK